MTNKLSNEELKKASGGNIGLNDVDLSSAILDLENDVEKPSFLIIGNNPNSNDEKLKIETAIDEAQDCINNQNIDGFYLKLNEIRGYLNNLKSSQPNHEEELNNILNKLEEIQHKYSL